MSEQLPEFSLVFPIQDDEVLLAMKKRGFGAGLWNGAGGKPEQIDKTMTATAIRECQEEILITPLELSLVGVLNFYFSPNGKLAGKDQRAYTYLCGEWSGQPGETEEMKPEWFKEDEVPYHQMWSYSRLCLPRLLNGEKMKADFHFDEQNLVISHTITPLHN